MAVVQNVMKSLEPRVNWWDLDLHDLKSDPKYLWQQTFDSSLINIIVTQSLGPLLVKFHHD